MPLLIRLILVYAVLWYLWLPANQARSVAIPSPALNESTCKEADVSYYTKVCFSRTKVSIPMALGFDCFTRSPRFPRQMSLLNLHFCVFQYGIGRSLLRAQVHLTFYLGTVRGQ